MTLHRNDRCLLAGCGGVIFLLAAMVDPAVSLDGAVLVQSAREMQSPTGDWLVPTLGGVPILATTPVLQWLTGVLSSVLGTHALLTLTRMSCAGALILLSLLTASCGSRVFGRRVGLMAGLMTLTTMSLVQSVGEIRSDLYIAVVIGCVMRAFLKAESSLSHAEPLRERFPRSLITRRSLPIMEYFGWIAVAAAICPVAVTAVGVILPLLAFIVTGRLQSAARQYVWGWGIGLVCLSAMIWPITLGLRLPGAWSVWMESFNPLLWISGFTANAIEQRLKFNVSYTVWLSLTWGLFAPLGMWFTRHEALGSRRSLERVVWMFASIVPMAATFLLNDSRTVLLSMVLSWNVLAADGLERLIEFSLGWVRECLIDVRANLGMNARLPELRVSRRSFAVAFTVFVCVGVPLLWTDAAGFQTAVKERVVLGEILAQMRGADRIAVDMELGDDAVHALYKLDQRAMPLHNLSFILNAPTPDVLVLTRRSGLRALCLVGRVEEIVSSASQTGVPEDELTLFRVRLAPTIARHPSDSSPISLAQGLRREPGPWIQGWQLTSRGDVPVGHSTTQIASGSTADVH